MDDFNYSIAIHDSLGNNGYYINVSNGDNHYCYDDDIVKLLGMTVGEYHSKMAEFGPINYTGETYMVNREDIERFKVWLEEHIYGYLVMRTLKN